MRPQTRILLILGGAAVAVVLFLLLRPDDGGDDEATATTAATTTTSATTTSATTTSEQTTTATTTSIPQATALAVTIRGGRPVGGIQKASVKKGANVQIVVRSDVSDEVHVHGYDLMRDVAPGKPARITVRATLTGVFEIELENRGLQIAELEVSP
jgi:hypothetical protein